MCNYFPSKLRLYLVAHDFATICRHRWMHGPVTDGSQNSTQEITHTVLVSSIICDMKISHDIVGFRANFGHPLFLKYIPPFPPPPPPPLNYEHSRLLHKISTDAPSPSSTQVTPASTLLPSTCPQPPIHPLSAQICKNAPWETPCIRHQIHICPSKAPPLPQQARGLCGPSEQNHRCSSGRE